jgi:hypothetical protein
MDSIPIDPVRVLQIYDPVQQEQFKNMTPHDRLEWLEAINQLYWAGVAARKQSLKTA